MKLLHLLLIVQISILISEKAARIELATCLP